MSLAANLPTDVKIIEVGPRDGLQNEKTFVPTAKKVELIEDLIGAGLKTIEITSFVSPKAIEQTKDHDQVANIILQKYGTRADLHFPCLVPNEKGLENALSAGVKEIALFSATSNEFNKKNINASTEESLQKLEKVAIKAQREKIKIRAYISTVFGCPYEGDIKRDDILEVLKRFDDMGAYEVSLGDTIGAANPKQVSEILNFLEQKRGLQNLAMHFHDTRSLAIANVLVSLQAGISVYDASVAGLGGCPYAKGATGNVATDEVNYLFSSMGISTGVDGQKLKSAGNKILAFLGKKSTSNYINSL